MDRAEHIHRTQKAGWLLFSSNAEGLVYRCGAPACREAVFVPESLIQKGEIPEACDRPHGEVQGVVAEDYAQLMRVFADCRRRLGLDQEEIAASCGLAQGHVNKLEAAHRRATLPIFMELCAALGYRIALIPAPVPRKTAALVEYRMASPMKPRWRLIPTRRLGEGEVAA